MRKPTLVLMVLLLLLQSCTIGGGDQANNNNNQTPPPQDNQAQQNNQTTPDPNAQNGTQPDQSQTVSSSPTGIIPSTNPDQRRREISTGKNDPFGIIPIKPTIIYPPALPPSETTGGGTTGGGTTGGGTTSGGTTGGGITGGGTTGGGTRVPGGRPPVVILPDGTKLPTGAVPVKNASSTGGACDIYIQQVSESLPPFPEVLVAGIINLEPSEGGSIAIVKTQDVEYQYSVRQGDLVSNRPRASVSSINGSVMVSDFYGRQENIPIGGVVKGKEDLESKKKVAAQLRRDQFNVKQNDQIKELKLISPIEKVEKKEDPELGEYITISGFICNNTNKPLQVGELTFYLGIGDQALPPLTAYFQGFNVGDISGNSPSPARVQAKPRTIPPGIKTRFEGSVLNNKGDFNTSKQIDIFLTDFN